MRFEGEIGVEELPGTGEGGGERVPANHHFLSRSLIPAAIFPMWADRGNTTGLCSRWASSYVFRSFTF